METLIDPENFVGHTLNVTANSNDDFNDFMGTCIGVRNGFLKVVDQEEDVFEVEVSQVTIAF